MDCGLAGFNGSKGGALTQGSRCYQWASEAAPQCINHHCCYCCFCCRRRLGSGRVPAPVAATIADAAASCLLLLTPPLLMLPAPVGATAADAAAGSLLLLTPPLLILSAAAAAAAAAAGDVWALGVCLYMFLFGCTPFSGQSSYQVYEAVQKQPLAFPSDKTGPEAASAEVKHLISR